VIFKIHGSIVIKNALLLIGQLSEETQVIFLGTTNVISSIQNTKLEVKASSRIKI